MKCLTPFSYISDRVRISRFSHPKGESLTVPDQSLTVREIMTRFRISGSVDGGRSVYYDSDGDSDDFDSIDPTLDGSFDLSDYSSLIDELELRRSGVAQQALQSKADPLPADAGGEGKGGERSDPTPTDPPA